MLLGLVGWRLEGSAADQARMTLRALGDQESSNKLARYRYSKVLQSDNSFLWGLMVSEDVICKNKKPKQHIHWAIINDKSLSTWGDQIEAKVRAISDTWEYKLAPKCKGEQTLRVQMQKKPFANRAELDAWFDEQRKALRNPDIKPKKIKETEQSAITL